jgi:ADP-ribose pyrophosphatase YjhB (NUDIX family)
MTKAGVILVNSNDEILLVFGKNEQKWSIPKGHIEKGETTEFAAHRELFEETGVVIEDRDRYKRGVMISNIFYFIYHTDRKIDVSENKVDNSEVDTVTWMDQNIVNTLDINRSLRNYLKYNRTTYNKRIKRRQRIKNQDDGDGWTCV